MGFCNLLLLTTVFLTLWFTTSKGEGIACKPPYIPNGIYSPHKINYTIDDEIKYECKNGFYPATKGTVAKCTSTGWIPLPRCSLKPCDFPQFKHGRLYYEESRRPYFPVPIGKEYSYYCDNGFTTPSQSYWDYLRCTVNGWEPEVPCLRQCIFHYVENGESSYWQRRYIEGQSAKVQCYSGYSLPNGQDTMICTENGWSPPPKCVRIKSCDMPVFENAVIKNNSTWFKLNDKIDYECHDGYENKYKQTKGSITCNDDGWSDKPSCYDSTKICGPPPPIDNGDTTSFPLQRYIPSSSVEYQCQSLYQLQGNKTIICINGEWSDPPKCLHPCIISKEIMEKHNITFRWEEKQKRYYQSGETQEFKCKNGHHLATTQPLITICINGQINYPTCTKSH
ncbi:complement factor H-related protein B precursor [Rattus norvegicus]|uniref:Cfh protein n=1 Tax=Rattus norvegicus TaxID=10116 RepID=Q5FVP9_RAT|nr:complement factor H-related protein B precursor [Rattus norvegicus]AAH89845.1 Cfh protein [Rattus norvegicus]